MNKASRTFKLLFWHFSALFGSIFDHYYEAGALSNGHIFFVIGLKWKLVMSLNSFYQEYIAKYVIEALKTFKLRLKTSLPL